MDVTSEVGGTLLVAGANEEDEMDIDSEIGPDSTELNDALRDTLGAVDRPVDAAARSP